MAILPADTLHFVMKGRRAVMITTRFWGTFLAAVFAKGAPAQAPQAVTVPAGTKILLVMKVPLHTTSAPVGSGLYLETLFPFIQDNRIVIPPRSFVQGIITTSERPGHLDRMSEFTFRFTSLVFPDNFVVPMDGALFSIPGADDVRVHAQDRKLEPVDQTDKVVTTAAAGPFGRAMSGILFERNIGKSAAFGGLVGLGAVLLQHGDEIDLPRGTYVEMILQSPLALDPAQVERNARYVAPPVPEVATNPPVPQKRKDRHVYPRQGNFPGWPMLIPGLGPFRY
jgi:type IV secretion system protein VirB10